MRNGEGGVAQIAVGLLGPLRVQVRGVEVAVSAARERAVLARLAIDAGRCVADHELIEAVWGDEPPVSARATLQTYVSHLRRLLGHDAIAREANGYRLCGAEVDVQTFDDALRVARSGGDPARRATDLRGALALWRGAPLGDLTDDTATAVRVGLEEDRVRATEEMLEARLDHEPPGAVVPALEERSAARRAGSRRWEAEAALALRDATWHAGSSPARLASAREALALASADDDADVAARCHVAIARDLIATGRPDEAGDELDVLLSMPALADEHRGAGRLQQAALALAAGDATSAAETIEWAAAGGHTRVVDDPDDPLATLMLVLAIEQGQLAEAIPSLTDAVARWPRSLLWVGALAAAGTEAAAPDVAGRLDGAAPLAERGPIAAGDVAGLVLLSRAASRTGHPLADRLGRQLLAHRAEMAIAGNVGVLGTVGDLLARS